MYTARLGSAHLPLEFFVAVSFCLFKIAPQREAFKAAGSLTEFNGQVYMRFISCSEVVLDYLFIGTQQYCMICTPVVHSSSHAGHSDLPGGILQWVYLQI